MHARSDRQLLLDHAAQRDESAFAEIVRRYRDLVYSAAVRQVRATDAAEVAQSVFVDLAAKAAPCAARLADESSLAGWLHRATRFAALKHLRATRRRLARETQAMHHLAPADEHPANWTNLQPLLDEAIDGLDDADRDALLLRFFNNHDFRTVGRALGISDDAAQKRVSRALDRLRGFFLRHGVTIGAAALATALADHAVQAAPAGFAVPVAAPAQLAAGSAPPPLADFAAMTKFHLSLAAVVAVAGTAGLVLQHREIAALRGRLAVTWQAASAAPERNAPALGATVATSDVIPPDDPSGAASAGRLQEEARAALGQTRATDKYFALMAVLQKLSAENWRAVAAAFHDERSRTGLDHPIARDLFMRRAGEVAGHEAVKALLQQGDGDAADAAAMGWASRNPAEVFALLAQETEAGNRRRVLGGAIRGLALTEPDLALRVLESVPPPERTPYTEELATSMVRAIGLEPTSTLIDALIRRERDGGTPDATYLKKVFSDFAALRINRAATSGELAPTLAWLDRHVGNPYVDHTVIAEASAHLARQDLAAAFQWLDAVNTTLLRAGSTSTAGYRVWLSEKISQDGATTAEAWLRARSNHPHYDHLAWQFAALVAASQPDHAATWAQTIRDEAIRNQVMRLIRQRAGSTAK